MDCNKDEAARVKALADRKLLDKDFVGAKKLIIKAQQLSKEVGDIDIPKMLTVCDVHCAAGAKENVQIDWYGILQVPETADDSQIKKQYHKLALLLHPDKNKFGGAEAAFKLVREANETLTDRSKRSLYDMKRVTQKTFWTMCPSCGTRYQYHIVVLKELNCWNQNCLKQFIARDLTEQDGPYGAKQQSSRAVVESSESSISETSSDNEEERVVVESSESSISETSSDNEEERVVVESSESSISETNSDNEEERAVVESSESSISETSSDSEEQIADHGPAANGSGQGQRSRQMQEGIPEKSLELEPAAVSLDLEDFPSTAQVVSIMHGSAVHDLMELAVSSGANQQYAGVRKNAGVPQKSPGPQTNVTFQKAWSATPGLNLNVASHQAGKNTKREAAANTAGPQDKMKSDLVARNPSKALSTAGLKRVMYNEKINDDDDVLNDKVDDFVNSPGLKRLRKSSMFHGDYSNKATNLNKEIAGNNGLTNGVNICSNTHKRKVGAHAPCGEKFNKIQKMERETMHGGENGDGKEKEFHSGRSNGQGLNNDDASDEYKFTSVDPEFFNFGQLRFENEFKTNQIWAVCDDQGCMPRFYAQITKVKTMPNFMLHFVWLELDPTNEVEAAWSFSGLPVACGRFKYGKSDTAKETGMFSRTISFEKSKTRNCFVIYPREGEVWALYKGWDIGWSSDPDSHKYWSHQYEVVQVLSDLTMSTSINVMPLVKIKGYDNLFMQSREAAPYVIPEGDTLRFSHCIPHHVMSAIGERVPEGSLELDPAALPLPIDLEEAFPSVIPECSSERSQERDARYAGSSSGNSSHEGSVSVGNGRHTACMNAGIAAKTPKEVYSEHNTTTASDDKFTFLYPVFFDFEQLRNERGVPKVSVELDRAALPLDMVETFPCEIPECSAVSQDRGAKYAGLSSGNSSCKGSMNVGERQHTTCMNAGIAAETPKEESRKHNRCSAEVAGVDEDNICQTVYVHAESEFYDFSRRKLLQKFSPGQIWALYSDVDKFPNYYGFIQKVNLKKGKVQVRWLDVCPHGEEEKRLLQEERTIGCGTFRLSSVHELITYTGTDAFSHCVEARSTGKKGKYEIIPHLGEIWAFYKNWRVGWTAQDFGRCEYELVEILGRTASSMRVQLLRKVNGYDMVFMPYEGAGSVKTIRRNEYPKFSHQIPCFRLTCENGGKLRGCMELDPLSLPEEFLNVIA